ncbi:VOC family protein [Hoeflea prorocentri]|uniref:VOC family protein n=1 Tax=Hoeflea prorocentri TaxID=1922333 RepID=A0A9X3UKC0_9HYPH|nr:VOC family protein [Hoeflea prorocentri]MCY6380719.1 VOC family protein [Hoeflea prorocentri]MDA5398519.1 VOC family protein [Hoeflea prorocentri]
MADLNGDGPRPVDHIVLPTADLGTARQRLDALGFTVAPEARHPFGTANACVFLGDGTFLEPIAVAQRELCERSAIDGNVFVARDQAYRFRRGEEGCSALVMGTQNAEEDRRQFVNAGISAGLNLEFARPFETLDGTRDVAGFELAFAADLRAPDVFFFTCERKNPSDVDKSALETHDNGVVSIRQVVLSEQNPSDFQYLLQEIADQREVNAHSFGIELDAGNATVLALNGTGLKAYFGVEGGTHARGLRMRGIVFATDRFDALEDRLKQNGIAFSFVGGRLVVPEHSGQGAFFAFEAV